MGGGAGQRRRRGVDRVHAGLDGRQVGGQLATRRVVGVQVHRQVEFRTQRGHQLRRGRRAQQPGHVLDGEHVRTGIDDLLGQPQIVVQRVQLLVRVGQISRVAQRHLGDRLPGRPDGLDGRAHLLDVVERVEDAEDVDAGVGGLLHEVLGHLGRVRRVADGVAATQQHLQADVGHRCAQLRQPLPRVFGQKPQRHVVGRAAPALQGQQLRRHPRHVRRDREQVPGAYSGRQQRLVGVPEGGVGDPDRLGFPQPAGETLRAELDELLLRAGGGLDRDVQLRQLVRRLRGGRALAVGPVDRYVGEVVQQPGAAVGRVPGGEQVRPLVDERGGDPARGEVRVVQHGL